MPHTPTTTTEPITATAAKFGIASILALNALFVPFILGSVRTRAIPFVVTPDSRTKAIMNTLATHLKPGRRAFVDIGSGDGRVVMAAKRYSVPLPSYSTLSHVPLFNRCVGVEVNSVLLAVSHVRATIDSIKSLVSKRVNSSERQSVSFVKRDMWKFDLSGFDVVMVFGDLRLMPLFREKFEKELRDGSLVVSNRFAIPGWNPISSGDEFYVYRVEKGHQK